MKPHKLSVGKRLTKPVLFGSIIVGLATAFINRQMFLQDVEDSRADEKARYEVQRLEVVERRERFKEQLAEKKRASSSSS